MKPLVLTGGHPAPAIAIAKELQKRHIPVVVLGRGYAFSEAKQAASYEKDVFNSLDIPFISLDAPRFPKNIVSIIPFLFYSIGSFSNAVRQLLTIKPAGVLTFGSYTSLPVGLAAAFLGVPLFIHDQTIRAGRANRFLSPFARSIFISWKETEKDFPLLVQKKIMVTGNPIRPELFGQDLKFPRYMDSGTPPPILYITGGSTGSHAINLVVKDALLELLKKYTIFHQVGDSHYNDYGMLAEYRKTLPVKYQKRYIPGKYVDSMLAAALLQKSTCIVGRSGANTTIEIALAGTPAVFIPLPYSQYNEQVLLAQKIEAAGSAVVIPQDSFSVKSLIAAIEKVTTDKTFYEQARTYRKSEEIALHKTSCSRIVDYIEYLLYRGGVMVPRSGATK